jgi:integrase
MARRRANGEGTIYKRKDGLWCASLMVGRNPKTGRAIRKVVYGRTQKEAKSKLDAVKREIYSGVNYARKPPTVAAWLRSWMKIYRTNIEDTTRQYYTIMIEKHLIPLLGGERLDALRPAQVQLAVNELAETLAPKTTRDAYKLLRAALAQAIREGYILRNPAEGIRLPDQRRSDRRAMSLEEQDAFVAALEGVQYASLLRMILYTGMRRGEALGLRWGDYDAQAGTLDIHRQYVELRGKMKLKDYLKTERGYRTVPLTPPAVDVLNGMVRQAAEQQIFVSGADTIPTGRNVLRCMERVCGKLGIKYNIHELRHTFATRCAEAGIPLPYVMYLMGDADAATVRNTYQHMADSSLLREYVQKIFGQNCHSNCHSDGKNDDV